MGRKIFLLLVSLLFIYIASPLIMPMAMGGVLAALFSPWADRLERIFENQLGEGQAPKMVVSGILTLGITVVLILPISFLISFIAREGFAQLQAWKPVHGVGQEKISNGLVESILSLPSVHSFMEGLSQWMPFNAEDLSTTLEQWINGIGAKLAELVATLVAQVPGILLAVALVVLSVYFFLVDRSQILSWVRKNSMFEKDQTDQLIHTMGGMCRSVILAAIVSGGIQAFVEGITVAMVGRSDWLLIGSLVFIASFIPLVGTSPVTLGVAVQAFILGQKSVGITLLVVAVVIMGIDNMVRPLILKGSANLHPFLAFVAALGGIQTLGFLGIFFGPILAGLFVATLQIFTQRRISLP